MAGGAGADRRGRWGFFGGARPLLRPGPYFQVGLGSK